MVLTDNRIAELLAEGKQLPPDFLERMQLKAAKRGHKEATLSLKGDEGSLFEIRLRQSEIDPLDFSAILACLPPGGGRFLLRRYNGNSHEHTNKIERQRIAPDFHVHEATERYQQLGFSAEGYATVTDRFDNIHSALQCLIDDCGFRRVESDTPSLPF